MKLDGWRVRKEAASRPEGVLKKCANECPPLEHKQTETGHVAACWVTK